MTATNDNHTTKKTREAHDAYRANRKEAGRVIDIETCEYMCLYVNICDPYCTFPRMMRRIDKAGAVSLDAGSSGATKATAGSMTMICRMRSGKRFIVGSSASKDR